MLDLPWRYKLIFPFFIIIPTISNYTGPTSILLPYPLSLAIQSIPLGPLFLLYITLLGIYCTNTINIYAGINGL
jgi:UDP-N-acetylglucosamine--dolichyl-phosphate N-acetylglucosaminephosphotransferase